MPVSTLTQIQRQIARLQAKAKAIESSSNAKKTKAVQKVRQLMDKLGVTMTDLGASAPAPTRGNGSKTKAAKKPAVKKAGKKSGSKNTVAIRYRDPETGNTWTGRGLPPKWMAEKIKAGMTKADFLIPTGDAAAKTSLAESGADAPAV